MLHRRKPVRDRVPDVRGFTRLWELGPGGLLTPKASVQNQIQLTWGFIAAQAIGRGRREYRLNAMYIEFENLADPETEVEIPAYEVSAGREYYDDLQASGSRDFLRVPLIQEPLLGVVAGYEDYFGEEEGNKLTFYALTQGTEGVHGKTFGSGVNSKVFGVALVAAPVFPDRSQDVIFARTYYEVEEQTVKGPSNPLAVTWDVEFLGL